MKKLVSVMGTIVFLLAFSGMVNASLVDDTVYVEYYYPYLDFDAEPAKSATVDQVSIGADDLVDTLGRYTVNIEGSSFVVEFTRTDFFTELDFNGLVIRDLNDDGGDNYILLGVEVEATNVAGWDDTLLTFGDDFVALNWSGLAFEADSSFEAILEFGPNPIPIPTAIILFVTGLIGFSGWRKMKSRN